ncbi:hypothetical protein ACRAWD_25775 [Caulobacter segnis]
MAELGVTVGERPAAGGGRSRARVGTPLRHRPGLWPMSAPLLTLFIVLFCFSLPKVPMLGCSSKALHEPAPHRRADGGRMVPGLRLAADADRAPAAVGSATQSPGPAVETIRGLPSRPYMARFLIGRMLLGDGISSFIAFGGVLAAGCSAGRRRGWPLCDPAVGRRRDRDLHRRPGRPEDRLEGHGAGRHRRHPVRPPPNRAGGPEYGLLPDPR